MFSAVDDATARSYTRGMKDRAAVSLGRRGGRKTAEQGSEYFRKVSALRKTKAGGRPRKRRVVTEGILGKTALAGTFFSLGYQVSLLPSVCHLLQFTPLP